MNTVTTLLENLVKYAETQDESAKAFVLNAGFYSIGFSVNESTASEIIIKKAHCQANVEDVSIEIKRKAFAKGVDHELEDLGRFYAFEEQFNGWECRIVLVEKYQ